LQRDKVEKYLAKIQLYDRIIETKRETIARLEIQAVGSSPRLSADKVQTSKRYDRMGDAATEIVMIRESIDRYLKSKNAIIRQIEGIGDVQYYTILSKRFILNKTYKEIAIEMKMSDRRVGQLLKQAYEAFSERYDIS